MKKTILAIAISLNFFSCKESSNSLANYKYADKPQVLTCSNVDSKLLTEAYYAFENAVVLNATNTNRRLNRVINSNLALRNFIARAQNNLYIKDFLTEEAAEVFKILKTKDIWDGNHLKYNSDLVNCIQNSISNPDIKQTFKVLNEVNSLDPKLMAAGIYGNTKAKDKYKDKALMTYVALDMFYAKMLALDFTKPIKYITKADAPTLVDPSKSTRPAVKKVEIGKPMKLETK